MEFSRRIIKIAVILVFLSCTFFANFLAIRIILRNGVDAYFYDKLLVAYNIGGAEGLKIELGKIQITDKLPRESMLAKDFISRLGTLADPEAFLKDKVQKSKHKIFFVSKLRSVANVIIFILFSWQMIINFSARLKSRKPS